MKSLLKVVFSGLIFSSLLTVSFTVAMAQEQSRATPPDNATADQQKNNQSDRDITQQIRKSVMSDKSLSTDAHNVKIISQNGMVTLKGQVRSEEEKSTIESKAAAVVGQGKVTDKIEVKPKQ